MENGMIDSTIVRAHPVPQALKKVGSKPWDGVVAAFSCKIHVTVDGLGAILCACV